MASKGDGAVRGEQTSDLQLLVDSAPSLIDAGRPDGYLDFFNQTWLRYVGRPLEDLQGWKWTEFIHPEDVEGIVEKWRASLASGEPFLYEARVLRADGEYRWMLHHKVAARDGCGQLVKWYGSSIDIEDRKRVEVQSRRSAEELQRSEFHRAEGQRLVQMGSGLHVHGATQQYPRLEAQLQATLNVIPAYTWYALPYGGLTFANERTADYLGLPKDHPLRFGIDTGAEWDAHILLLHPDDREEARRVWSVCIGTGSAGENSQRVRNAEGGYRWFLSRAEPLRASDGTLLYWIGVNLDIDERKRAEEEIREQELELQQMMDLSPQQAAVFGPAGERIYANRTALGYGGVSLEEWRQTPGTFFTPGGFIHPDDLERMARAFSESDRSGGSACELELQVRGGDGNYRWSLIRFNPLYDDKGQVKRWYVALTDIDERKRAEERLQQENVVLREEIDKASMFEEVVGTSKPLQAVLSRIAKVAPTDSTVLITGETGTGKELIARAVHKRSQRSGRSFISVNCAALPPTLVTSELFGHEKGAFTGATQRRIGRFEMANGGTIFLDEVGELLPDTQAVLLRVLQEREFERVGGGQPIHTDVRVIAATNRDLNAAVAKGTFRQDLLYRLNVFPVEMPPLRERKDDILMLVEYFVQRYASRAGKSIRSIDQSTLDLLQSYDWPGNVRELQNVIERSIILSSTDVFSVDEPWLSKRTSPQASQVEASPVLKVETRSEREIIEAALAETRGRVSGPSGAAAKLRIPQSTLDARIRALKINKQQFKFG
jgi:formate hydrogenlyase transcriptional activator